MFLDHVMFVYRIIITRPVRTFFCRRFDVSFEVFIGTDFRFLTSVSNLSQTQLVKPEVDIMLQPGASQCLNAQGVFYKLQCHKNNCLNPLLKAIEFLQKPSGVGNHPAPLPK